VARGLRVVGGTAGGLHLVAPRSGTRPTADRVKEALFAALGPGAVQDAVVADLYAGSGALGIEALSRGAARAVFVDRDRDAVAAVRANLTTTRVGDRARVQRSTVSTFLATVAPEAPFDLVLVDPPYSQVGDEVDGLLAALAGPGMVAPDGLVVVESPRRADPFDLPEGWGTRWSRTYGDTLVTVVCRTVPSGRTSEGS
jgi:16S rRNA (guanine966-N2)-methyltransferase